MSAREEGDNQLFDNGVLPDDDLCDFFLMESYADVSSCAASTSSIFFTVVMVATLFALSFNGMGKYHL